ncbi:biotin synthase auxiliary protein BsaP [Arthrobacter sp. MAHUQ-56]
MNSPAPRRAEGAYCGLCGGPASKATDDDGSTPPSNAHLGCASLLLLEPPRFCASCGRRQKVQVSPQGWWATCSRHGVTASD